MKVRAWTVALTSLAAVLAAAGPGLTAAARTRTPAGLHGSFVPGQVLVRFHPGVSGAAASRVNAAIDARTLRTFTSPTGLQLVRLPAGLTVSSAISSYRQHAEVLYAERNQIYRIAGTDETVPNDPDFNLQWNWRQASDHDVDASNAWDLTTGSPSVIVGLIDTGVQTRPHLHPDLKANIWSNTLECNGQPGTDDDHNGYVDDCHGIDTINGDSDPDDDFNHGTHVAGIMGAVGNNGVGVTGINWHVKVLPCKSHDNTGLATEASVLECLAYIKAIKDRGETVVATNNSYGGCTEACGFSQAFRDAIVDQMNDGILFVAAAGNSALNHDTDPSYPSSYYLPNVISAAATDVNDGVASFSDYGRRTVEVGAPGVSVYSTLFTDGYGYETGTSMASPHVTGLAGLIKAYNPSLDWRAIRNLIIAGGDNVFSLATKSISGRRINANGSLTCSNVPEAGVLRPLPTVALSPQTVAALNIRCANPAGGLRVRITPGGARIRLRDNGQQRDIAAGDGIYSGAWTPAASGDYVLHFSNGLTAMVHVQ